MVAETAPQEAIEKNEAWKKLREAVASEPVASHEDIDGADAVIFGTPTRFGNVAAQLKAFIDTLGPLGFQGKLADKAVAEAGGNPYGPSVTASRDGVPEKDLAHGRHMGQRVAKMAAKLSK